MSNLLSQPSCRDLDDRMYIEGVYGLYNPQVGTTRNGKPFLKCVLRDSTGEVNARQWSFDERTFEAIAAAGFVEIKGKCERFQGQVQLILDSIAPAALSVEQMAALLPSTDKDIDAMFVRLAAILDSFAHPGMRALAQAYLRDEALMAKLRVAPAASSLHHAWIGGLLEHTLQLLEAAELLLPLYPALNRDIVLMGLFLHDLAKTAELDWEQGFSYTDDGNLIGHVVRGAIWLETKVRDLERAGAERLPEAAIRVLEHIVISHHGLLEHGAAKIPSTPEAIFISQLDNLDAKTTLALTAADRNGPKPAVGFTDKIWALETRLYRPDPMEAD